jgi:hypothetical protein
MNRFVFRPVFVADGNFKADHVKRKKDNDVWLFDGGGMVPNQQEYSNFLKTALEIPTVSQLHLISYALRARISSTGPYYTAGPYDTYSVCRARCDYGPLTPMSGPF